MIGPGHRGKPKWQLQLAQIKGIKARVKNGNAVAGGLRKRTKPNEQTRRPSEERKS